MMTTTTESVAPPSLDGNQSSSPATEPVADEVARFFGAMRNAGDSAVEISDEWAETLRCTVRDHPLAALAVALALGAVVGRLTAR